MPTFTMQVFRGDPTGGEFRDYKVEADEGMVVLDVIHRIQATQAPDLACRWNCKAGKCGSCSAEIDGKPRLMCMTRMDLFQPGDTDHGGADPRRSRSSATSSPTSPTTTRRPSRSRRCGSSRRSPTASTG